MNKGKLTAQWWQHFFNDTPMSTVYFVKGRMVRPNHPEPTKTLDRIDRQQYETILITINNWIGLVRPDSDIATRLKTQAIAIKRMNSVFNVDVTVNNETRTPERIMSPFFDLIITMKNVLYDFPQKPQLGDDLKPGEYKAVSDGYWLFLKTKGLEPGEHKIKTFGSCATGVFTSAMEHCLVVT